jgi:hypothetical protein
MNADRGRLLSGFLSTHAKSELMKGNSSGRAKSSFFLAEGALGLEKLSLSEELVRAKSSFFLIEDEDEDKDEHDGVSPAAFSFSG